MPVRKPVIKFNGRTPTYRGKTGTLHSPGVRTCYIIDNKIIVKIDDGGYTHRDMEVWESIKPDDRKYFVPTLATGETPNGDRWSCQPWLVGLVTAGEDWKTSEQYESLIEKLKRKYRLCDLHGGNWGIYNGQPIIFDYGLD